MIRLHDIEGKNSRDDRATVEDQSAGGMGVDLDGEGLFAVNMLARVEDVAADNTVCGRNRQVDDQLDVGVGEERLDAESRAAVLCGLGLSDGLVEIRASDDLQHVKGLRAIEVGLRDFTAPDDADADLFQRGGAHVWGVG